MASKNKNPYSEKSAYGRIFDFIRKAQVVTRKSLLEAGFTVSDVTVVLSPRAEGASTRGGDPRGNMSAQGHIYYMEKLKRKKGEDQKFRLRWRKTPLDKLVRPPKVNKDSQKTGSKKVKTAKTVKAEATEATEATVEEKVEVTAEATA